MSKRYYHPQHDYFRKNNLPIPEVFSHGTEEDIRAKLKPLKLSNWRMEGPGCLVADSEVGKVVNHINPSFICTGTDTEGLPVLTRIGK